ncbi:hypothetical protein GGI43DRAFT_60795 [Trichoderma evansii]
MNRMDALLPLYTRLSNRPHYHYKFPDKQRFPYQTGDLPCWAGRSSNLRDSPRFSSTALTPDKMLSHSSTRPIVHNHALRLAPVVSKPRSSSPSFALHVKTSVAVVQHWANVPGMDYMLNQARYPDWETEARLRAVKPAGREARSVDGKTAQQRFHFNIWLPLWTEGLKLARQSDDHQSTGFVIRYLPVCRTEVSVRMARIDDRWLTIKKCKRAGPMRDIKELMEGGKGFY